MNRLWSAATFLINSLTGLVIAYCGWLLLTHPTPGVQWSADGTIDWVSQKNSISTDLASGSSILLVDGRAPTATDMTFPGKATGDTVTLTFIGNGQKRTETLPLLPPDWEELTDLGLPFPTALAFWLVGALLLSQRRLPQDPRTVAPLAGVFLQLTGVAFAIGNVNSFGPAWLVTVYLAAMWVLGSLATILHLRFPRAYRLGSHAGVTVLLSAVALIGSVLTSAPRGADQPRLPDAPFLWLAVNLLVGLGLLVWSWWRSPTLGERRQMGVVAVGGILALGPFLGILIIPSLLYLPEIPGAQLTLLSVALLPISYGYAILRYRRMAQDRFMARVIVYAFTTVIVVIVFFLVMAFPGFRDIPSQYMIWIAALLGGVVAGPMMRGIERWLSWMLFGRWTQPLKVASDTMAGIDLRVERRDLSTQVREIISRQLQIHDSAVLLLNKSGRLYDPERTGQAAAAEGVPLKDGTVLWRALADNVWVCEFDEIRSKLLASPEERAILQVPWAQAMLPLRIDKTLIGLVLVGYRTGVTFYDIDELIVLQLTAMSAAAAFDRRKLFIELEGERDQASMLSQQVITVRGEERKRIARDLHDDIIQPLIAQSYGLAVIDAPLAPELRDNTLKLVEKIREICAELRDPTLDTLGLGAAVRAAVAAFQMRTRRLADLVIDQDPNATVPDQVASAALGVLQEALTNAHKHAEAQTIQVRVNIQPDVVRLNVRDDGRGFDVLEARKRAAKTNHFGLLGADERVAAVGGAINVQSLPGQGTNVDVYLPYMSGLEGKLS